eukprot:m.205853 g.205853  ORF g.205853 m.205853 type:complete len:177 (-) comp22027_c0_seq1:236-766(-)
MIKLFSLRKEGAETTAKKSTAAQLRAQKDHSELQLPSNCELEFDNADDLLNFRLVMKPTDGFWAGGRFVFSVKIGPNYPHEPPKVHCDTKVYHPNIDLQGNVCLNILREDWKPVLNLQSVIYGLVFIFLEPNPGDPLNKDAATLMEENKAEFQNNVRKAMRGGTVDGERFDACLAK